LGDQMRVRVACSSMNRDSLRMNGRRPRWQVGVVALALSGLILSGCAPQDAVDGGEQSPDESAPTESAQDEDQSTEEDSEWAPEADEADSPEPEIEAEDGFWRLNTLPEPVAQQVMEAPVAEADGEVASAKLEVLSLDTDGEFARMVVAWLPPEDGAFLGS